MKKKQTVKILPWTGQTKDFFYPKAYQSSIHPLVKFFLKLSPERIAHRYCHLHPQVQRKDLIRLLHHKCRYFFLAWSDLMYVTNEQGKRSMVVIENNSCPSGQKSMPPLSDDLEHWGYEHYTQEVLIERIIHQTKKKDWVLAVLYDKNEMETVWYAHTFADLTKESVYYVPVYKENKTVRSREWWLEIKLPSWKWKRVRWCMRYVTQKPWTKLPLISKTIILNPIITCLAWGRNKLVATKAYESYNNVIKHLWLSIKYPDTIYDVSLEQVVEWIERRWGIGVVKNPYSNAWQWVYTITSQKELDAFMDESHEYDKFIVQSLIWNYKRSSKASKWTFYHVWTLPNKQWNAYVVDVRMRIISTKDWFMPLSINARKALLPLAEELWDHSSWDMLWTNLSYKNEDWSRGTDMSRLLLMDTKDFNQLWIGIDDLIEWYIQSVLSTIAIDRMAHSLITKEGKFRIRRFQSLDNDKRLLEEITHSIDS